MQNAAKSLSIRAFSHSAPGGVESKAPVPVDSRITSDDLARYERVALLVEWVGGLARAAEIARVTTSTINNWRKKGAALPVDGMLLLCTEAGLSLDWIATGHMIRPDLATEPGQAPEMPATATLIRLIDARVHAVLQRREARA